MVTQLSITLDNEPTEDAGSVTEAHGLTWAEFLEAAADAFESADDPASETDQLKMDTLERAQELSDQTGGAGA
ncbi:hypothetical protein [Haloquadratum walsbyi]|jgi:hypothetical protein|uniref:Uncharacterized protein n=1 Tax=Haloquadratum walsbyi J07HQW2 TaxID=1238425 RepID=U1NBC5_9EURY|nr:hypothetical protein [Haloquadratum walsbyi]ERG93918.1 MAG: hypothetical protein J07HQW2_00352 [Haloquadratum walsbyi J07HQW2]